MALTPDEEKRLREQVRQRLADRESRLQEGRRKEVADRQKELEDRIRRQIVAEEEEKYFSERGYIKYTNRHGTTEWLPPEEAEKRVNRRRSKKKPTGRRKRRRNRRLMQWGINIGGILIALLIFTVLMRFEPEEISETGNLIIQTDVPGARIFLNGQEKHQYLTPDTLLNLKPGAHFVTVHKAGYTVWPPMQHAAVKTGEVQVLTFSLTTSLRMGTLQITTDRKGFQVYVDGIVQIAANGEFAVPAGYHVVSVVKRGYITRPFQQRVLIREDARTSITVEFERTDRVGYMRINSNRSSPYIFVSGQLLGRKPNDGYIPVDAGVHEVRICENGFSSSPPAELVHLEPGDSVELAFHMQPETVYDTLQIITPEPGAAIIIDGRWISYITPIDELLLSEGTHYINLMRNGVVYAEKELEVDLIRGKDRRLQIDF